MLLLSTKVTHLSWFFVDCTSKHCARVRRCYLDWSPQCDARFIEFTSLSSKVDVFRSICVCLCICVNMVCIIVCCLLLTVYISIFKYWVVPKKYILNIIWLLTTGRYLLTGHQWSWSQWILTTSHDFLELVNYFWLPINDYWDEVKLYLFEITDNWLPFKDDWLEVDDYVLTVRLIFYLEVNDNWLNV